MDLKTLPTSVLLREFESEGRFVLILVVPKNSAQSKEELSDFEHKLILFAASNIECEEDITDAFFTCGLKPDEGMKVLGGGQIEIQHERETITVKTTSVASVFGHADNGLVSQVLKESYEDYKIEFV